MYMLHAGVHDGVDSVQRVLPLIDMHALHAGMHGGQLMCWPPPAVKKQKYVNDFARIFITDDISDAGSSYIAYTR
jgi:hypothetical protein